MHALRLHGSRHLVLDEVPDPTPGAGQVVLRVTDAAFDPGLASEIPGGPYEIDIREHPLTGFEGPMILGKEYGGTVEDVGTGVDPMLIGCQVAVLPAIWCGECRQCLTGRTNLCESKGTRGLVGADGGLCSRSTVSDFEVIEVGRRDLLTFVEPLLQGIHAARRAGLTGHATALVLGSGPLACALAAVWQDGFGTEVSILEPDPDRADRLRRAGLRPVAELPEPGSHAVVVDTDGRDVGDRPSLGTAVDQCRAGGTVVLVGRHGRPVPLTASRLVDDEIDLISSVGYDLVDVAQLPGHLDRSTVDFSPLIHRVAMRELVGDDGRPAHTPSPLDVRIVTSFD